MSLLAGFSLAAPNNSHSLEIDNLEMASWAPCAKEGSYCAFEGQRVVRYGADNTWYYAVGADGIACSNTSFGDPAFGRRKECQLGEISTGELQGARVAVLPVFYVFSNVADNKLPGEKDKVLLREYLKNARAQFASILSLPLEQSFEVRDPIVHRGIYSEQHIGQPPSLRPGVQTDLEHAIVRELLTLRGKTRLTENHVYLFVMVRDKIFTKLPRRFAGGRSFNGGINGGGGIVVLEYAEMQFGFYGVLVHELGHAFGLTHVDCYGESMKNSDSIMSYNPLHRSRDIEQGRHPGTLLPQEKALLLLNSRVFPSGMRKEVLQKQASGCVLPAMDSALGPLPTIRGVGYDLVINGRLANGPDATFFTKQQAEKHCSVMKVRHTSRQLECRYAGKTFYQHEGARPGP
jgi:hypothetical protein